MIKFPYFLSIFYNLVCLSFHEVEFGNRGRKTVRSSLSSLLTSTEEGKEWSRLSHTRERERENEYKATDKHDGTLRERERKKSPGLSERALLFSPLRPFFLFFLLLLRRFFGVTDYAHFRCCCCTPHQSQPLTLFPKDSTVVPRIAGKGDGWLCAFRDVWNRRNSIRTGWERERKIPL